MKLQALFTPFVDFGRCLKSLPKCNSISRIWRTNWIMREFWICDIYESPTFSTLQPNSRTPPFLTQFENIVYCFQLILGLLKKLLDGGLWQSMGLPSTLVSHKWLWSCNVSACNSPFLLQHHLYSSRLRCGSSWILPYSRRVRSTDSGSGPLGFESQLLRLQLRDPSQWKVSLRPSLLISRMKITIEFVPWSCASE